jgi:hypothetical protein
MRRGGWAVLIARPLMSETVDVELRTVTMDDAEIVADLEATRDPQDPRDPILLRFWWATRAPDEDPMERVAESNGSDLAFVGAGHEAWEGMPKRFGWIRPALHPKAWSESRFGQLLDPMIELHRELSA